MAMIRAPNFSVILPRTNAPVCSGSSAMKSLIVFEHWSPHMLRSSTRLHHRLSVSASGNGMGESSAPKQKNTTSTSLKESTMGFFQKRSGYLWLLGPIIATTAIVLPPILVSISDLLQKNYFVGLAAIFGMDLAFILAADAYFVLSDKTGHHQTVPYKVSPWVGPWEILGYPKGLPYAWEYTSYVGIFVASLALLTSLFVGKLGVALAGFGPYMALVFVQAAYERLLCKDRLPTYPIVGIVYGIYRFKQLARAMELFGTFGGGVVMVSFVRVLMGISIFYLASYLCQLPWFYCMWNSNRIN